MTDKDTGLLGQIKQKLLDSKKKWADDGRLLTGKTGDRRVDRLPPGQHEVKNWPVLDLGIQPKVEPWEWSLAIDGLVENPITWSFQDFLAQPPFQDVSDIHCVTAWSRYDNLWRGVSTRRIAQAADGARHVILKSHDAYVTCVTVEDFLADGAMLATHWDDKPLTRAHGGPVRLVIPHLYFWKSPKWLRQIWFTDQPVVGYWEARGYHKRGDPWTQQRYE